jgi:hypothetical protein
VSIELFLATAVILSPVDASVTWQWVHMSQHDLTEKTSES